MEPLIFILGLVMIGCGMQHDVEGGTENKVTINHTMEICEDERFTKEEKLECIKAVNTITVEGGVVVEGPEGLTTLPTLTGK